MLDYELIFSNTLTNSNDVNEKMWVVLYNMISGPRCQRTRTRDITLEIESLEIIIFFCLSFFRPCSSVSRALDCDARGIGFNSWWEQPKNIPKKIQCWVIFLYGFSEPISIKYEVSVRVFHQSELFVKIQLGVVMDVIKNIYVLKNIRFCVCIWTWNSHSNFSKNCPKF